MPLLRVHVRCTEGFLRKQKAESLTHVNRLFERPERCADLSGSDGAVPIKLERSCLEQQPLQPFVPLSHPFLSTFQSPA